MLIMGNMNLISVQSWTYLQFRNQQITIWQKFEKNEAVKVTLDQAPVKLDILTDRLIIQK